MSRKKRILYTGEFSGLNTGYATISRNLLAEFVKTDKYEVAELACIPDPHAKIAMSDGSLSSISNIKVGDFVISHTGNNKKVLHTYINDYDGDIVRISRKFFSHKKLEVTANHPILVIKKGNRNSKIQEWIRADEIKNGDYVAYATQTSYDIINKISVDGQNLYLDEDLALVFGWFLAKGYVTKVTYKGLTRWGVYVYSALHEEHIIDKIHNIILHKFNINTNKVHRPEIGVYELLFESRDLARLFSILFGTCSQDKFISELLWNAPREFILKMLAAYFEGDGTSSTRDNCISAITSSARLSLDITRLLLKHGIRCGCQYNHTHYQVTIAGEYARELSEGFTYKNKHFDNLYRESTIQVNNLTFYLVKRIEKYNYKGKVYNLHIEEDNSYVCNDFVVHNCYCKDNDPYHQQLKNQFPWKIYGNLPTNEQEEHIYKGHPAGEFGRWKFDVICLDFQPDIILDIRDKWMHDFIDQSPLRRFFKTVFMPTCDAKSQNLEWIDLYQRTDHVLTYTDFAYKVFQEEGAGLIPLRGVAAPAVDVDTYKFSGNRAVHKQKFGLDPNSIIIGMVARNQRRKLYPDFGSAFVNFLERMDFKNTENVYLYWHTSHPDVGWDIPKYITNLGLSHKVLMTYFCQRCRNWFPSFYQDAATICKFCGTKSATLSNSQMGVDTAALASIYNFMDLYVQFVSNEGAGLPTLEAAACGSPICGTYYSGTEDYINNLDGHGIKPDKYWLEAETSRLISYPSIAELTDYIEYFTRLPASVRHNMSVKTEQLARKFYGGWSSVAKIWMDVFDSIEISEQNVWASPPDFVNTNGLQPIPLDKANDEQYISWLLGDVLRRPEWINSYVGLKMLRDLGYGRMVINNLGFFVSEMSQLGGRPEAGPCNRQTLLDEVVKMRNQFNQVEGVRQNFIQQGKIRP